MEMRGNLGGFVVVDRLRMSEEMRGCHDCGGESTCMVVKRRGFWRSVFSFDDGDRSGRGRGTSSQGPFSLGDWSYVCTLCAPLLTETETVKQRV